MRYLSLLIFISVATLTWHISKLEAKVPLSVHNDIQTDFAKIIEAAIKEKLPSAREIQFSKLYTRTVSENEVNINFQYSYQESETNDATVTGISGTAQVRRDPSQPSNWELGEVSMSESFLEFKHGLVITREGVKDEPQN